MIGGVILGLEAFKTVSGIHGLKLYAKLCVCVSVFGYFVSR